MSASSALGGHYAGDRKTSFVNDKDALERGVADEEISRGIDREPVRA
jgi:hypothetical protein